MGEIPLDKCSLNVDLLKSGVYKYASSPDFEILLFGYAVDDGEVQVVDLAMREEIPAEILNALEDRSVTKWAFNAAFERVCLSRRLGYPTSKYLDPEGWKCTSVWSAVLSLPQSLHDVGAALRLEKQKLTEGKDLIRFFCKPAQRLQKRNLPLQNPEKWESFKFYNLRDVEVEMSIHQKLSQFPVPDSLWEEYWLDQKINDRGICVDRTLVENAIALDEQSKAELFTAIQELTGLDNPNSVQQMKRWLADNGMELESLDKRTVAERLQSAPEPLRTALTLRQQLAKSSVKNIRLWKKRFAKTTGRVVCFNFTARTGQGVGRGV